jgi:hypothetical protein
MENATTGIAAFLAEIDDRIAGGNGEDSRFAVLTFETLNDLRPAERRKLVSWGDLVLGTCLTRAVRFASPEAPYACVAVLPSDATGPAAEVADYYCEQLNKLPVGGIAPGNGWRVEAHTCAGHDALAEYLGTRLNRR